VNHQSVQTESLEEALHREFSSHVVEFGLASAAALLAWTRACESWTVGRWDDAYAFATQPFANRNATTTRGFQSAIAAFVAAGLGDDAALEHHAGEAREAPGNQTHRAVSAWIHAAKGHYDVSVGDHQDSIRHFEHVQQIAVEIHLHLPVPLLWEGDYLDALIGVGDLDNVGKQLESLTLRGTSAGPAWRVWAAGVHARARAQLAPTYSDAADHYATALAQFRTLNIPFETARTLLTRGTAMRTDQTAARDDLQEALRLFRDVGATNWEAKTHTQWQLNNSRSVEPNAESSVVHQEIDLRGDDGPVLLTVGERRVAKLVVAGLTYKQISNELFVSVKTVDFHMQSAFRKVGVNSRAEFAARFAGLFVGVLGVIENEVVSNGDLLRWSRRELE
jgi:DNA-binding CsgD family transcriptional regulator